MADAGLIVSVSGIRGIVGRSLTPEATTAFAAALATQVQGQPVVVSRDGRPSGTMLRHAVLAGLLGGGCNVLDLGIAPTPTFGLAVRRLGAAGGVQITASHNPAEWNGLKLFGANGQVLSAAHGRQIKAVFDSGAFARATWDRLGTVVETPTALDWHRERVLELLDAARIRTAAFRVFLDANGGAGGPLGLQLLESLGCTVAPLACEADGVFLHEPEPIETNLRNVGPKVKDNACAIGFVLDPDADRLALIDEQGRYLGEELTLALAVRYRLSQQRGPVVVNLSTSRVTEDVAKQYGCACHRAPVGEANVAAKMVEVGAVIGGEGNGGVMDPRVGLVRDPFIGMGLILSLMAETGRPLSALADELPHYAIVKEKFTVAREKLPELYAALERRWPEANADRQDGLRLDWSDRWVQIRGSNTEPVVRVIAEAPRTEDAVMLCREVGGLFTTQGA